MGYIHDTNMCIFLPPEISQVDDDTGATWDSETATNVWSRDRSAGDGAFVLKIPVHVPHQNAAANKGSRVTSIDIWYQVLTAALDCLAADIQLATLPAHGSAWGTVVNQTFTYDANHDTAGERVTVAWHKMTLTFTAPDWLINTRTMFVQITIDAAATSIFKYLGARVNYTLRI